MVGKNFQFSIFNFQSRWVFLVLLLLVGCVVKTNQPINEQPGVDDSSLKRIQLGEKTLEVEIADDSNEITRGLGYRDEIGSDGMLFVMPRQAMYTFWMKGMRVGLDMIWIDCPSTSSGQVNKGVAKEEESGCVVADISEKIPAPEDPEDDYGLEIYQPKEPVTHVLEVDFGKVEEWGVEVGDKVELN